jgi:polyhydroxyalkanoate synthesis repressor PhaR
MSQVRIIKRYANRKLYDTQHSRYVTLDQISEMIRNGDDVKIIDNKTKEDLTSVTLAQIIFEEEKKQRSFLPLQAMRNIIQNGGESLAQQVTEAQRRVTSILPRRKDGEDREGDGDEEPALEEVEVASLEVEEEEEDDAAAGEPGGGKKGREGLGSMTELRDWVLQSQRSIDEWHKRVDDRIRHMVEGIYPFTGLQKDVKVLADRIASLEAKLEQLAAHDEPGTASEPSLLDTDELNGEDEPMAMEAKIVPLDSSKAQQG